MRHCKLFFLLTAVLVSAGACKSKYELLLSSNNVEEKYKAAFEHYNAKKYKKSASLFESLAMQTNGMDIDDTVRYYWALSNYKNKDYMSAEANFGSFTEMYARSPFTMEARFLKLDCMYRSTLRYELDQNPTRMALLSLTEYKAEYPESQYIELCNLMMDDLNERLDKKEFENARLYYKMEDYIAAKTALKNVLKDHPDNRYREDVMYYLAKASYKYAQNSVEKKQKERYMDFVDYYYNFVGEFPESRYRAELDQLYNRYQRKSDSKESAKALRRLEKKTEKTVEKDLRESEKAVAKKKEADNRHKDDKLK